MGKNEYCPHCLEFYRRTISRNWGTSSRIVTIPGCNECHERHETEVYAIKNELQSLQAKFKSQKSDYEDDLADLETKRKDDLLQQKTKYEKLLLELKLKASLDANARIDVLKADNDSQQKNLVQLLQAKGDLLEQAAAYQQLLSKLKLKVSELEADNDKQRNNVRFLEAERTDDLLRQEADYKQLLSEMKLKASLEVDDLKAYYENRRKRCNSCNFLAIL